YQKLDDARTAKAPFQEAQQVAGIARALGDFIDALGNSPLAARVDELDWDQLHNHYYGQTGRRELLGEPEHSRKGLAFAEECLRNAATRSADLNLVVRELFFDADLWPAGWWFRIVLRTIVGENVWFGKESPGASEPAPLRTLSPRARSEEFQPDL